MEKYILIIDNEQLLCHGLKRALNSEKVQIDTASAVVDAIARHNSRNYDLCLLDIKLSDENCLTLIETIRGQWPEIKIILMTTCDINSHEETLEYILQNGKTGVSHLLCKPFDLRQLKDIVAHGLNKARADRMPTGTFLRASTP